MTDKEALDLLHAQGYCTGTPDAYTGFVRVWSRGSKYTVDVRIGQELHDVAQGKLSMGDICERREDEMLAEP